MYGLIPKLLSGWGARIGALLLVIALCAGAYQRGYENGSNSIQVQWNEWLAKAEKKNAEEIQRAREVESNLRGVIVRQEREFRDEVASIDARYQRTIDGLRDRTEERTPSPASVPEATGVEPGNTGAGLAGPDARFLAGYAADAAKLQAALNQCVAAYDEVRKTYK